MKFVPTSKGNRLGLAGTQGQAPWDIVESANFDSFSDRDLVVNLSETASVEQINAALKEAAEGRLKGTFAYCHEPLVSSDFRGNSASSIVDALSSVVLKGKIAKVVAWCDKKWGYSCCVGDLATLMAQEGL